MNVDDLLDPLRYQNLRDYTAANLELIGGGVFTERDTLEHLRMLDLIAKAYQSVHLPTLGKPIPQSSFYKDVTISSTSTDLITAKSNEILEIISIFVNNQDEYGLSAATLYIYPNGQDSTEYPIYEMYDVDALTSSFSGLIFGASVNNGKAVGFNGQPLYLNGGDSLGFLCKSSPDPSMALTVVYRKVSQ